MIDFKTIKKKFFPGKIKESISEETSIYPHQICNLSKIPSSIEENPLVKIACACEELKDKNRAWKEAQGIFESNIFKTNKTLSEFYSITSEVLKNYNADHIFLPWTHYRVSTEYSDVFIKVFYDQEYQYNQFVKMYDLVKSIKLLGYEQNRFRTRQKGISGYFLQYNGEKVF